MPIPPLTDEGWLPPGEHESSIEEIADRFGGSETNPEAEKRRTIMRELRAHLTSDIVREWVAHAYVDGSFVSSRTSPNDVDIVLGLRDGARELLFGPLGSQGHAIITKLEGKLSERVGGHKLINGFVAEVGDPKYNTMRALFQSDTRVNGPRAKGILRVVIR